MRGAAALANESDLPARPTDPFERSDRREWQGRCGPAGDPPAGERGRGKIKRIAILLLPPAAKQGRRPAFFRSELKPPCGRHQGPPDLADDGGEGAMADSFFHDRQSLFVIAAIGVEDPVGRKACLSQSGSKEITPGQGPQDLASAIIEA